MNIKTKLKEAASRQIINDVDKNYIISNIDTTKIIKEEKRKIHHPKRLIPLFASLILIFSAILSISIYFGTKTNNNTQISQEDLLKSQLEQFYQQTTVSEANNMINVVNTFEGVSFDVVTIIKPFEPEMELSIVNDVDTFIDNIENMYNIKNNTATLINNIKNNDYKNKIEINSNNYSYDLYFNEELIEEKNVTGLNYKYKSEIKGIIISNNKEYRFEGLKRIKNSRLEYETTIFINDDYYVEVKEVFTMNSDLSLKYDIFKFEYNYHNGDNLKKIRMEQKFDSDGSIKEIRFVANEGSLNEFKMSIYNKENYLSCKIDSSGSDYLYITSDNEKHNYKFKNSNEEYIR